MLAHLDYDFFLSLIKMLMCFNRYHLNMRREKKRKKKEGIILLRRRDVGDVQKVQRHRAISEALNFFIKLQ